MSSIVLAVNSGSSSVKATVFDVASRGMPAMALHHLLAEIYDREIRLHVRDADRHEVDTHAFPLGSHDPHDELFQALLLWFEEIGNLRPSAIGHRVAHGGPTFRAATLVDDSTLALLDQLVPLAPLHQPYCLGGIRALAKRFPGVPQIACFDTAFHATLPEVETRFALPIALHRRGIRRYGFHGLSYAHIADVLPRLAGERADGRVIVAHLGSGASLCAMHGRQSVATTMGFTALDGLMMGTRCGALDPGVVLYMAQALGMSAEAIADTLYHHSGLLGVSGESADMRVLLKSASPTAAEAAALFCYRVNREMGAMAAALGGVDAIVFTGGIGEHGATVRADICRLAAWLGIELDEELNAAHGPVISTADSRVKVYVIEADEEQVIADEAAKLCVV
ncbi:MAG: acetate/propionate family kinase [Burkholderiales bacterium]|nr:acetate/propionate family kinase [Burkholderiales bacterium]